MRTQPALFVLAHQAQHRQVEIATPDGIAVKVDLAPIPRRAMAFIIDSLLLLIIIAGIATPVTMLAASTESMGLMALVMLVAFFVRQFYFFVFELLHQGRTPGKRALKLRVIARDGQALRANSLLVRNLTRDVEVILPLALLLEPDLLWPGASALEISLSLLWAALFALLPFFNRERLRIGDFLAGTVVSSYQRRERLHDDPAIGAFMRVENQRPTYSFSPEQLEMYGIFELHVLEKLVTQKQGQAPDPYTLKRIAAVIREKIGWKDNSNPEDWQFIHDFYAALRARHERKLLLGERQEFKLEGALTEHAAIPGLRTLGAVQKQ